jgi:hypothetical protein
MIKDKQNNATIPLAAAAKELDMPYYKIRRWAKNGFFECEKRQGSKYITYMVTPVGVAELKVLKAASSAIKRLRL